MRLINADKLRTILIDEEYPCALQTALIGIIDAQPTAYDVDKVVKQLETEDSKIEIQYENNYEKGLLDGIGKAIEIVKAGGIDVD